MAALSCRTHRHAVWQRPMRDAGRRPQSGYVNRLDFESRSRVMILDRDTEPGARGRQGARKKSSAEILNPLNQAILPASVVKRGAGE